MRRLWNLISDPRALAALGLAVLYGVLAACTGDLAMSLAATLAVLTVGLVLMLARWWLQRRRARRAASALEQALNREQDRAVRNASDAQREEIEALRQRLRDAVRTIKTSKLGQRSGSAALYELPWFMIIGSPAAGKSTAVVRSGLEFPFAEQSANIIQGIGGTRNCDWFFASEGILLDTAGRYAVEDEHRDEWRGFLQLLKRYRPRAPINGILVVASITDLTRGDPDLALATARQLRQRMQELTEQLEVHAPVYVVFTKADQITGFAEFFEDRDRAERERPWGATLPYRPEGGEHAMKLFERHYDELFEGLKDMSVARMSLQRGERMAPGVLAFPLEFASLKPALSAFVATLFEENPYQHRPVFRGFYFTSAVQEGSSHSRACERIAGRYGLDLKAQTTAAVYAMDGFFLKDLFAKVIFADGQLVRQHTSRAKVRLRQGVLAGSVLALGVALGAWTWSYAGNRQLLANVDADLAKLAKLQRDNAGLQARIEALEVLQDRIEQLRAWRGGKPWRLGFGLYQGDAIERKLSAEYYAGIRDVMLQPVAASLESYLAAVNAGAAQLQPLPRLPASGAARIGASAEPGTYQAASPESVEDAYNALKTYLMLSDRSRMEAGHLTDQITRFWRGWLEANRGTMPREALIRSAERMLGFVVAQLGDPLFPQLQDNYALVDATRENLRRVVRGMPARERVYSEIKSRAETRYAPATVAAIVGDADRDVVAGSYAVSGAYSRAAWTGYVRAAIDDAATRDLQSTDWVLKTASHDDLTLEGSPEQIRKALIETYKTEYVAEWQKFLRGITVREFGSFDAAVARMNRLGDPADTPIRKLLARLADETSWDQPGAAAVVAAAPGGWYERLRARVGFASPAAAAPAQPAGELAPGPVAREFEALARLTQPRADAPAPQQLYLEHLAKIRTRFNQIRNQGDPGPAARQFMAQTLDGGSELAEALRFVDEQLLSGSSDSTKASLRPLLVRPLMQAYAVLIGPTEGELNRVWTAQVYEPFQRNLAAKYPFDAASRVEATPAEIAQLFGPDGAIARFQAAALGTLVLRRGDEISAREWAQMGVRLSPAFTGSFARWVAPPGGAAPASAAPAPQTRFQVLPLPAPGLAEYTLEIDGQVLRYRNSAPAWSDFSWPGPGNGSGVRISGVALDGRSVEFLAEPGSYGLERMVSKAQRKPLAPSQFELSWPHEALAVAVQLRIVSTPGPASAADAAAGGGNGLRGLRLPESITQAPLQVAAAAR